MQDVVISVIDQEVQARSYTESSLRLELPTVRVNVETDWTAFEQSSRRGWCECSSTIRCASASELTALPS